MCEGPEIITDISLGEVVRKRNRDSKRETDTESEGEGEREGDVRKKGWVKRRRKEEIKR